MAVKDWIMGFLDRHQARFAPHDWPADGAAEEWREFTKGWITALALRQVTEAEADDASSRLAARPPPAPGTYPGDPGGHRGDPPGTQRSGPAGDDSRTRRARIQKLRTVAAAVSRRSGTPGPTPSPRSPRPWRPIASARWAAGSSASTATTSPTSAPGGSTWPTSWPADRSGGSTRPGWWTTS